MAEILDALFDEYKANRSPISSYGMERRRSKDSSPSICGNCKKMEDRLERFKVCRRCKQVKVPKNHPMYHHYCCKACQTEHWKIHRLEHTEYEIHQGPFLDNERADEYQGKIKRFRFGFEEGLNYTREQVLEMMIKNIGKPNLLSVFAIEKGKYWVVDMKDGPYVERVRCEGTKHSVDGIQIFRTFPCLLKYGTLYPDEDIEGKLRGHTYSIRHADSEEPEYDTKKNVVELRFTKHPDIKREEVLKLLNAKFSKGCLLSLYESDQGVWHATMKKPWQVDKLLNTGLQYQAKGGTHITYPKYLGKTKQHHLTIIL